MSTYQTQINPVIRNIRSGIRNTSKIVWMTISIILFTILYLDPSHSTILLKRYSDSILTPKNPLPLPLFQPRTIKSVKSEYQKGAYYQQTYSKLTSDEIANKSAFYHRNITLQWDNRFGILPPSKPLPDRQCLRYLRQGCHGDGRCHRDERCHGDESCLSRGYDASVTIVMCFRNELMSLLYRTLTTIVRNTPTKNLNEIILIDDGSERDQSEEIQEFCDDLSAPCKVLRNANSSGIANVRYYGIRQANSDVVVILDSHMEVSQLWLEPLLDILESKPGSVAIPIVQMITEIEYEDLHSLIQEPYGIELNNGFGMINFYSVDKQKDKTLPYPSSSLAGGALAARKSTLLDLYPVGMVGKSWGVENHRFALRSWMCGGGLWMSYCSQIIHANGNDIMLKRYSQASPHLFSDLRDEIIAEILNFMGDDDNEKEKLLKSIALNYETVEKIKNISKTIRGMFEYEKMGCNKNYAWYLENVHKTYHYKYLSKDSFLHIGELQSVSRPAWCLANVRNKVVPEYGCRGNKTAFYDTHLVAFSRNRGVRFQESRCWDEIGTGKKEGSVVFIYQCHTPDLGIEKKDEKAIGKHGPTQQFEYVDETQQIRHMPSNRCMEMMELGGQRFSAVLNLCQEGLAAQKWNLNVPIWLS